MELPVKQGLVLVDMQHLSDFIDEIIDENKDDEILNLDKAAELLESNRNTLSNDIKNGSTIPYQKIGTKYKFSKKAILKWLNNNRRQEHEEYS